MLFGMQFEVASSDEEGDPPDSTATLGASPLHAKSKGATTELHSFPQVKLIWSLNAGKFGYRSWIISFT